MRKIINKIIIISLLLILIANILSIVENISKAANYNFNLTGASQANNGDTLTFTITANGLTGNVKLSGSNVSLSNSQVWVEKNTVTFTAKVNGFPASVTASPQELTDNDYNIVDIGPVTKTITEIQVSKPQEVPKPETNNGGQTSNQNQGGGSNGQTNQGQTSTPQTNPEVAVQSPKTTQNQGTTSNSKVNPAVTAEGEVKSSNNYLKNLQVSVGTLTPEFYRENYEYTIDNIIEDEIEILAEAEDEKAVVNGIGTIALVGGENRINIEVIAENEQTRTYTIIVNKLEQIKESDLRLNSLEIQTINESNEFNNLDIGFDKEQLDYRVTVDDNITDLSILATVDKEGVIIETEGDKNLKEGENIVTITLTNQSETGNIQNENISSLNGLENPIQEEKTIYTIKVTRRAKPIVEISNNAYQIQKKKNIAGIILLLLVIVLIIIIIFINNKKNNLKKYKRKRNKKK